MPQNPDQRLTDAPTNLEELRQTTDLMAAVVRRRIVHVSDRHLIELNPSETELLKNDLFCFAVLELSEADWSDAEEREEINNSIWREAREITEALYNDRLPVKRINHEERRYFEPKTPAEWGQMVAPLQHDYQGRFTLDEMLEIIPEHTRETAKAVSSGSLVSDREVGESIGVVRENVWRHKRAIARSIKRAELDAIAAGHARDTDEVLEALGCGATEHPVACRG